MIAYEARESCLPGRGAVPTARGIRVDTKVSTLMNPVSFWDSTAKFAELRLAKEQQSGYFCVSFSAFSQFTDNILLHIRAIHLVSRLWRAADLCSSTVSDFANTQIHGAQGVSMWKKKTLPFPICEAVADFRSAPD